MFSLVMGMTHIKGNLFMENFKQNSLSTAHSKPEWWLRYVDDNFIIWAHGREELVKFVDHLNKQSNSIKFTMEMEESNFLPFLDTMVIRKQGGGVSHKFYKKKTHTGQYIHTLSHHHP